MWRLAITFSTKIGEVFWNSDEGSSETLKMYILAKAFAVGMAQNSPFKPAHMLAQMAI